MSLTSKCYCYLYEDEPWAKAARRHGYEPCQTESSARHVFGCMQEEVDSLLEALEEAIYWDAYDEYGVSAVWLSEAEAVISKVKGVLSE